EKKGVHLKSSNAPYVVNKKAEDMMLDILNTVWRGEKVSLYEQIKMVADVEREIFDNLAKGSSKFCRRGEIKDVESYKLRP
ncbi:family B DNA polymerase, partial [Streptococcus pyogenes]